MNGNSGNTRRLAWRKSLLLLFSVAACIVSGLLIIAGYREYQAKQDYLRAAAMISGKQNIEEGLAILEAIHPLLEKDVNFLQEYGMILSRLGRNREAIQIYENALQAGYFPAILENLSSLYLGEGDCKRAIDYAEKALLVLPWKLGPRLILAEAFLNQGDRRKAFEYALETVLTPMKVPTNRGMNLKRRAREILSQCGPDLIHPDPELETILSRFDAGSRGRLLTALMIAGPNRAELEKALLTATPAQLEYLVFLLENMPEPDLRTLDSLYLLDNIDAALEVRNRWAFMPEMPHEVFLNYVLPYAQIGETRDKWRRDFMERYLPVVEDCKSAGEILLSLQIEIITRLNIQFDREGLAETFWSVGETIESGLADCVSFSILVADVCRAVGLPARVVVIPKWKDVSGGHAWIEIYDQGEWRHTNSFDLSPLNQTWFEERAAATDPTSSQHRIYGASFRRTGLQVLHYGPHTWWTDETGSYVDPDLTRDSAGD